MSSSTVRQMIFWGATGQAKVLRECLSNAGIQLIALFDRDTALTSPFEDVPLYHGREGFEAWSAARNDVEGLGFLVAIGGDRGSDRVAIQEYLTARGLIPLTAVHRTAFVAESARVGVGSQILARSAVSVDAVLGRACIVNTGAIVDHDCRLGDGVHLGPGAQLAGSVDVGNYAFVGAGATILPRVRIGSGAVVGAGSVVVRDVDDEVTVAGNPAVPIGESRR